MKNKFDLSTHQTNIFTYLIDEIKENVKLNDVNLVFLHDHGDLLIYVPRFEVITIMIRDVTWPFSYMYLGNLTEQIY